MTIKEFIEKAIEGGWDIWNFLAERYDHLEEELPRNIGWEDVLRLDYDKQYLILLDPLAWQAVGKVEGWKMHCYICKATQEEGHQRFCSKAGWSEVADHGHWRWQMHRMIDALCEGQTIEQFLSTL